MRIGGESVKKLFCVLLLLLLTACQNSELVISNQSNLNEEVMLVDNYNINIPIATTTKISSLEVLNLNGINTDNLEYEIDYYLDNKSKTKGYFVYSFMLSISNILGHGSFEINSVNININDEPLVFDLNKIKIQEHKDLTRNNSSIIFDGAPVTLYDYTIPVSWDFAVNEEITITNVHLSNTNLKMSGFKINGAVANPENLNVNSNIGDKIQLTMDIIPNTNEFKTAIVGTDLVIEFITKSDNKKYYTVAPAITRFYGSGESLEKILD